MIKPNSQELYPMKLDKLLFVHIPKTAGISLNNQLKGVFGGNRSIRFGNSSAVQKFRTLSTNELRKYSYITGHIPLQQFRDKGIDYPALTVIREPVDRLVSTYRYLQGSDHPDHKNLKFDGIEGFIDHVKSKQRSNWQNTQCKFISGTGTCDASVRVIETDMIYVVPLPRFDDMIENLSRLLPQTLESVHLNKSKRAEDDRDRDMIRAELESFFTEDFELYKIVTQNYTEMRDIFLRKLLQ